MMYERCVVLSVSIKCNSLPMWANYTDKGRGFVIEFDGLDKYFSGDDIDVLNKLYDVEYMSQRSSLTFESSPYKPLFFQKYKDWEY